MSTLSIGHHQAETLENFLRRSVTPLLDEHAGSVDFEIDVDDGLPMPADARWTGPLVQSLVRAALHEMPQRGELLITACQCGDRIELEIADNGSCIGTRFRWRPLVAAKIGATLVWQDCPQGGAAVTVQFPSSTQSQSSQLRRRDLHTMQRAA